MAGIMLEFINCPIENVSAGEKGDRKRQLNWERGPTRGEVVQNSIDRLYI